MKIFIFILLVIICCLSVYMAYIFSQNADKDRSALHQERYLRMIAEEEVIKNKEEIDKLNETLSRKESKISSLERKVEQEKLLNSSLDKQIQDAKEFKESLQVKVNALESQILDLKEQISQEAISY